MSVAYRIFDNGTFATIKVVNGFELDTTKARASFKLAIEVIRDKEMLESLVKEFAVKHYEMNPKAIHVWECKDLGENKC